MTRNQLNSAIDTLLDLSEAQLEHCRKPGNDVWQASMAASIVFSGLARVLINIRQESLNAPEKNLPNI